MSRSKLSASKVLDYSVGGRSQSTVRRFYLKWRNEQGLPLRCDNAKCTLHRPEPQWNAQPLPLILDHIDGNRAHNRPANLRLLCPNCDSQLYTRGGKNKGRIQSATKDSFHIVDRSGRRDVTAFLSGVSAEGQVGNVGVKVEEES
jgi:hypothetical protein